MSYNQNVNQNNQEYHHNLIIIAFSSCFNKFSFTEPTINRTCNSLEIVSNQLKVSAFQIKKKLMWRTIKDFSYFCRAHFVNYKILLQVCNDGLRQDSSRLTETEDNFVLTSKETNRAFPRLQFPDVHFQICCKLK